MIYVHLNLNKAATLKIPVRINGGWPLNEVRYNVINYHNLYNRAEISLFNTLKKETNLFLDSMTPSSAFATLISMKQGEKTQKIVAKYVCDRFRERDRRVKYNLV